MMKKILIAVVLGIAFIIGIFWYTSWRYIKYPSSGIRKCPQSWYYNQMPLVGSAKENNKVYEYFIIDGERKEYDQVDVRWVVKNCPVNKPETIQ